MELFIFMYDNGIVVLCENVVILGDEMLKYLQMNFLKFMYDDINLISHCSEKKLLGTCRNKENVVGY